MKWTAFNALNPQVLRAESLKVSEDAASPAEEVARLAEEVKAVLPQYPSVGFEAESPARMPEAYRAQADASWRLIGNWALFLIFLGGAAVVIVALIKPDSDLALGTVFMVLLVVWIFCQLMRLIMIMGYGKVKIRFGSGDEDKPDEDKPDEDKPDEDKPDEDKPDEDKRKGATRLR
jgi:hypothetical protein